MTETKISLQTGNQPFARQSSSEADRRQATAQIQNAITHTHREALKEENGDFA